MKARFSLVLAILCCLLRVTPVHAQATAFTYQGRLSFNNSPANGSYDLRFIPFNATDGGSQVGSILTNQATAVTDGIFTVPLDFGTLNFLGTNYWLEVAVRTNGAGLFTTLSPRQAVTAVPQAHASVTALTALNLAGVVENNRVNVDQYATVGGGLRNTNLGYAATVAGGERNVVSDKYATVGGGKRNATEGNAATVAGGEQNLGGKLYAAVGGGYANTNHGYAATIAGGYENRVGDIHFASVGGGFRNKATETAATVAGGYVNSAGGLYATVGGGLHNRATNDCATVPGGFENFASGQYSFAGGRRAHAPGYGSFVWNSYSNPNILLGDHQFQVFTPHGFNVDYFDQRPDGGGQRWLYIGDNFPGNTITVWNGAGLSDAGVWINASDRARKTDFQEVDSREILERLEALPVRSWRYTNENPGVKHLGPTAQDFRTTFGLGLDEKGIGTVDADGIALAAIQGLNRKLVDELTRRDAAHAELKQALEDLQRSLQPSPSLHGSR